MRTPFNKEQYISDIITNNSDITFKDLNNELKNTQSKITYICQEHGEYTKRADYLREGRGCSKCTVKKVNQKNTTTTEDFIKRSNIKHDNKYDYSKSIYTGSRDKITIICPVHGEFEQEAVSHMTKGYGCQKCGFIETARKGYITNLKTESGLTTLYYIKCYGKDEVFYKIGIAKDGALVRFSNSETMPYLFEILREIRGDADRIVEIEKSIKISVQPYTPLIPFNGSVTECTKEPIDLDKYLALIP